VEVARRVAAVEAALGGQDLAGARAALARLAELEPEHAQIGSLRRRLEETEAQVALRGRVTVIAASVRQLLSRDDLEAAGRAVEEALALDGEDAESRALLARVHARREERERGSRAQLERRVAQAQARLDSGDLLGAIEQFEGVLAEEQGHEGATRGLAEAGARRTALDSREAAAARQAAIDDLVAAGKLRLAEGDLVGGIERFEAALREDGSHAAAQRELGEAQKRRAALDAQEKEAARRAALDAQVTEGRLRLSQGDLIGAIQQFEGVLAEEGGHDEARRALAEARQRHETLEDRVAAERHHAALESRVAAGRQRLSTGDVAGAIEHLEGVLAEDQGHAEARRTLAEARERLTAIEGRVTAASQRAALEARVAAAQARLTAGDLAGAIERFEGVVRDEATHAAAVRGLEEARGQRVVREAKEQETVRRAAFDARVAEAQARLAAGDLVGAIERFEVILKEDGAHAAARRGLGEARERWAALDARVAEARAGMTAGNLAGVIERLESVLRDDETHAAARQGLAEARQRLAAQRAREVEVGTALSALEGALQQPDLDAVQAAFTWVVELAPDHPQRTSLEERIAEHRERIEEDREQTAREGLADAGRLIREGQPERSLEVLAQVRALAPQHPDLPKLERQARRLVGTRGERIGGLVASVGQALERGDLDAAQRGIQEALAIDAKHPGILAAQERLQERVQATARERVGGLVASVGQALERGDLDAAQREVQEALTIDAKHPEVLAAQARVQQRVQAHARETDQTGRADDLAAEARRLLEEGKLDESEARQAELRDLAPTHPQLGPLKIRLQARRNDPDTLVKNGLDEAAKLIREGRPERVAAVLAKVRAVAPQNPQLDKLEAQAQKVLEARDVRGRVRDLLDRARKLQAKGEVAEGLALAEEAVKLTPDDGRALRLRDDLAEQLQEARRRRGK
jgi:hypothetical protein